MIERLNNKDEETAKRILEIQTAAYKVEAEIIGFYRIPALNDTIETIINSEEIYLGYKINSNFSDKFKEKFNGIIAGVISYEYKENVLEICKMVVDPIFSEKELQKVF